MVMARRALLREVRQMAIRAEAAAMQLRGRLVVAGQKLPAPPAATQDRSPDRRRSGG